MNVIARNTFHSTEAKLRVRDNVISAKRAKKLRGELCATDCACFWGNTQFFEHEAGYRNSVNREMKLYASQLQDGGILLEA